MAGSVVRALPQVPVSNLEVDGEAVTWGGDPVLLELRGDGIVLACGARDKEMVKRIPGGRWDKDTGLWVFPLGWATCKAARGVFGARLEVGPELAAWSNGEFARLQRLAAMRSEDPELVLSNLTGAEMLKPWQRPGVAWMAEAERALQTDDVGLGKTIQTLMALKLLGPDIWPVLIICPNSLKLKWAREFEAWGPAHGGIVVVDGSAAQKRKQLAGDFSVAIINWEALRLHSRLAPFGSVELTEAERTPGELDDLSFRTVVADEGHRGVNPKSKQTRAWWNLSHQARYRYVLTATPLTNKPDDFWAIGHGLWPENFPRKTAWVDRYCHAGTTLHGGWEVWGFRQENKDELFSFVDPFMIRRTGEVAGNEPPLIEERPVVMGSKQAKAYRDLQKEWMAEVDFEFLVSGNPLDVSMRLRQVAAGYPVLGEKNRRNPVTGEDETYTGVVGLKAPSCKIDALLEMIEDEPVEDEPLVVFAESRLLMEACALVLEKRKVPYVPLNGTVSTTLRDQHIARFQEGDVHVALCTYGAVAEGISLGRSRHLVRLQVSRSMLQNKQAIGRIDGLRRQKPGPIKVTDIITVNTTDADVTVSNLEKAGHLEELLRDRLRRGE